MAFKKRMFNKTPRRIHRNKGGRKKGTIYNKPKKVKKQERPIWFP